MQSLLEKFTKNSHFGTFFVGYFFVRTFLKEGSDTSKNFQQGESCLYNEACASTDNRITVTEP